jgi:predicted site-specific integrase-resolvase
MSHVIPEGEALITATQACEFAGGVSKMTLRRWIKAGVIPKPIKIRKRNYFRRADYLRALKKADRSNAA